MPLVSLASFLLIRALSILMAFLPPLLTRLLAMKENNTRMNGTLLKAEILAENSKTNGATAQGRINDVEISAQLLAMGFSFFFISNLAK